MLQRNCDFLRPISTDLCLSGPKVLIPMLSPLTTNDVPSQTTRVPVPLNINVFHINKSCFQLEDALASGSSRSPNLG